MPELTTASSLKVVKPLTLLVLTEELMVVARRCHLPPTSLPATRKTAGWEEEKCQEMVEEEMAREVMDAGCSGCNEGLHACWHPGPQVGVGEQICDSDEEDSIR